LNSSRENTMTRRALPWRSSVSTKRLPKEPVPPVISTEALSKMRIASLSPSSKARLASLPFGWTDAVERRLASG
jgi:hypothetical protein